MKKSDFEPTQPYCPPDCPFLSPRSFLPNTLPFYCDKYETYLTAEKEAASRCARCLGINRTVQQTGVHFIQTLCPGNPMMVAAFKNLKRTEQKMFVDLLQKTGMLSVLPDFDCQTENGFMDSILKTYQKHAQNIGSPEYKKFNAQIDKLTNNDPTLLTRQTKTLLMNLFMVMDNSEKHMMQAVFQSPGRAESFLKQFKNQPKDNNLLKDTRRILYEENDKRIIEKQQEKNRQQEKNALQKDENNRRQERAIRQKQLEMEQIKHMRQKQLLHER